VRTDLDALATRGQVHRVRGGAIPRLIPYLEQPLEDSVASFTAEKVAIGQAAAALIRDGETVLIDVGSTAAAAGFRPEYLAGFDSPRYDIDADAGFASARQDMAAVIQDDCRADIGGDEQRVDELSTADQNVLFRLLLLPLWIATYITGGKTFHVFVNANTGEVIGERPYSAAKIISAVMAVLVAITAAYLIYKAKR